MGEGTFDEQLKVKMHIFAKGVYRISKQFPVDERFGMTSQLRRAALSVPLNYIEGFARFKRGTKLQFFEIAYGSLKETKYLLYFAESEGYMTVTEYQELFALSEEIGKMLWKMMVPLRT